MASSTATATSQEWTIEAALDALPGGRPIVKDRNDPLAFYHLVERLKSTKRSGWTRFEGIERVESVADHSYRMSIICMLPPSSILSLSINLQKSLRMCLIHDLAESLVGDIMPSDRVPRSEKHRREHIAISYITTTLLGDHQGKEVRDLWDEFEENETIEARFANDVDKIEMLLQMRDYEIKAGGKVDLGEFMFAVRKVQLGEMKALAERIVEERRKWWRELGMEKGTVQRDWEDQEMYYGSVKEGAEGQ